MKATIAALGLAAATGLVLPPAAGFAASGTTGSIAREVGSSGATGEAPRIELAQQMPAQGTAASERDSARAPEATGPRRGGRFFGPRWAWQHRPEAVAARLAAAETLLGIRSDQLDVWRDYTNALLALVTPPDRTRAKPDGDALARQERFADVIAAKAAQAETLKSAIAALRTKLSPEQIEKLNRAGPGLRGAAFRHGPHHFRHGPHHFGHWDRAGMWSRPGRDRHDAQSPRAE